MDQQRPGHLADLQPQRRERLLAVAPRAQLVVAEAGPKRAAEMPRTPAVTLPGRQPCAQLRVSFEHGPVHQPLPDLAGRVDDEGLVASSPRSEERRVGTEW